MIHSLARLACLLIFLYAASGSSSTAFADSNDKTNGGEWITLFDGNSLDAWRGFRQDDFPENGWEVEGNVLRTVTDGGRTDIITRDQYSHYELELEWKVGPRGNSGIFYHVSEEPPVIWHWAPEIQILDDTAGNLDPDHIQSSGSLYDIYPPSADKEVAPVGEFNTTRLVVRGSEVEHWLNGKKILEYDLTSEETRERVEKSKFPAEFGTLKEGHVGLQHHGSSVGFRNIRIRVLEK